jgi:hypothetical protein
MRQSAQTTRGKPSSGRWGGEATRLGKAPHAPSCQCNLDSPPQMKGRACQTPLLECLQGSRGASGRLGLLRPPRALASPQIGPSRRSCAPGKLTLLDHFAPVTGELGLPVPRPACQSCPGSKGSCLLIPRLAFPPLLPVRRSSGSIGSVLTYRRCIHTTSWQIMGPSPRSCSKLQAHYDRSWPGNEGARRCRETSLLMSRSVRRESYIDASHRSFAHRSERQWRAKGCATWTLAIPRTASQ